MKILHIMQREKFTSGIVGFYDKYFANGEHEICYLNFDREKPLICNDVSIPQMEIYLSNNNLKDVKQISKQLNPQDYDYIAVHSFLLPLSFKLYLFKCRSALKKTVWIEWGADLYSWKPAGKGIKSFIRTRIEYRLRTKVYAMVGIFPPDCDVYKKTFPKSKAKVYYAPYSSANRSYQTKKYNPDSRLAQTKRDNDTVYIQVGHSAAPILNHIEVLESLKNFSKENIKIFLPLSYGDKDYADKVQKYAEQIFGDKLFCLREMMPKEEYFALVERIDIAVFNTHRQIALANINLMVFNNVKLYMPQNSVMYEYFTSKGAPIQKFENLKQESFGQLSMPVFPKNAKKFEKYLYEHRDMKIIVDLWEKIYGDFRNNLNEKR